MKIKKRLDVIVFLGRNKTKTRKRNGRTNEKKRSYELLLRRYSLHKMFRNHVFFARNTGTILRTKEVFSAEIMVQFELSLFEIVLKSFEKIFAEIELFLFRNRGNFEIGKDIHDGWLMYGGGGFSKI